MGHLNLSLSLSLSLSLLARSETTNESNLIKVHLKDANYLEPIHVSLINARSVQNKTSEIADYITDYNIDICAITETWLTKGETDTVVRGQLTPSNYSFLDCPRSKVRSGGVGVVHRSNLKVIKQVTSSYSSFELTEMLVCGSNETIRLLVVYRPPPGGKTGQPTSVFLEEFYSLIDNHATTSGKLLILGDFNLH